jgi:hypothetical protein
MKISVSFFRFIFQQQGFPDKKCLFDAFGFFGQKFAGPMDTGAVKNRSGLLPPNR